METTLEAQGPVDREVGRLEPVAWRWDAGYGTYICQCQLEPSDGFLSAGSKWEPLYADADVQRLIAERDEWKEKAISGARAHAEFVLKDHPKALAKMREACGTAYGLLWMMTVDTATKDGLMKSLARAELREMLTDDERAAGIERAKAHIE